MKFLDRCKLPLFMARAASASLCVLILLAPDLAVHAKDDSDLPSPRVVRRRTPGRGAPPPRQAAPQPGPPPVGHVSAADGLPQPPGGRVTRLRRSGGARAGVALPDGWGGGEDGGRKSPEERAKEFYRGEVSRAQVLDRLEEQLRFEYYTMTRVYNHMTRVKLQIPGDAFVAGDINTNYRMLRARLPQENYANWRARKLEQIRAADLTRNKPAPSTRYTGASGPRVMSRSGGQTQPGWTHTTGDSDPGMAPQSRRAVEELVARDLGLGRDTPESHDIQAAIEREINDDWRYWEGGGLATPGTMARGMSRENARGSPLRIPRLQPFRNESFGVWEPRKDSQVKFALSRRAKLTHARPVWIDPRCPDLGIEVCPPKTSQLPPDDRALLAEYERHSSRYRSTITRKLGAGGRTLSPSEHYSEATAADPALTARRLESRGRSRLNRRWHALPSSDVRRLSTTVTPSLWGNDGAPRTRVSQRDFATTNVLSTFTLDRREAAPKQLPSIQGVFSTEMFGVSATVKFGGSTASNDTLENKLQLGIHDPRQKALTSSQANLSVGVDLFKAVNFDASVSVKGDKDEDAEIVEPVIELWKEVIPDQLILNLGKYLTPFGIHNMRPQTDWYFLDAPLAKTRLLGPDGLRGDVGFGVTAQQTGRGWRAHAGIVSSDSENMGSYLASTSHDFSFATRNGGRPYAANAADTFSTVAIYGRGQFDIPRCRHGMRCVGDIITGVSGVWGQNATGDDGSTWTLGADLLVQGPDVDPVADLEQPRWIWQTEFIYRGLNADASLNERGPSGPVGDVFLPGDTLHDYGIYTQGVYAVTPRFAAGARLGWVSGNGQSYDVDSLAPILRSQDPWRGDRFRASALFVFRAARGIRIRLQYSHDEASFLGHGEDSIWMSADITAEAQRSYKAP